MLRAKGPVRHIFRTLKIYSKSTIKMELDALNVDENIFAFFVLYAAKIKFFQSIINHTYCVLF